MTKNMGSADRIVRSLAALVIGALMLTGVLSGTIGVILGILAVVFLLTSAMAFCPLYLPLKLSTIGKGKAQQKP
jgi:hypothetical protein